MIPWLFLAGQCWAQANSPLAQPLPFEWPRSTEQSAALLQRLTNRDIERDVFNNSDDVAVPSSVETFTFAQLEQNKIYLVASVDGSGRDLFYATAFAYCESPELCTTWVVPDAPPHNYSEELVDLDGSGLKAIVAKELAGGYEGGSSVDIFTYKIFKVIDGKALDVSAQYRSYYENTLLPRMKAQVKAFLNQTEDGSERQRLQALGMIVEDEYARRILKQPNAGLEHAKAWAHSGNSRLGDYALNVLSQIDSPESDTALSELSKSDDERMAKAAARELEIRASARENERLKQSLKSPPTVNTPH